MRAAFLLFALAASPLRAEGPTIDDCAIAQDRTCAVEVLMPNLTLVNSDPVATGADQLTFLALAKDGGLVAVDLSLADGSLRRSLPLQLGEGDFRVDTALIAQGGNGYLLHMWQGSTELGLLFVDAGGEPAGLMRPTWPADWPMEMSLATAVMELGVQNQLAFDGAALQGTVYRFGLRLTASDGRLLVVERDPPAGEGDTLGAYLERRLARQIDPVGAEAVRFEGPLSAVATWVSDGTPSRLLLRSEAGGEIAFDQRLGPDRMEFDYTAARVTGDGRHLAAIRAFDAGPAPDLRLMVFDAATTAPVLEAPLPAGRASRLHWLPDRRIVVLQDHEAGGVQVFVLGLAAPPG